MLGILAFGVTSSSTAETWYAGKGLKQGDYFRYSVCWVDWHKCSPVEIDFWVKNQTNDGTGWNLEFLAVDGPIVQKGIVTIGTATPNPIHSDLGVYDYANIYNNTIAWLDSVTTKDSPKDFSDPTWASPGISCGKNVGPKIQANVTVQAGTFNTWIIGWIAGVDEKIWVAPNLPFPVKATIYNGCLGSPYPVLIYDYELLQTGNSPTDPRERYGPTVPTPPLNPDCPYTDIQNDAVHGSSITDSGSLAIEYRYSPTIPHQGCPIEWRISFENISDMTQKYSQIHYDIFSVDQNGVKLDSVAQDRGKSDLFAPVGDDDRTIQMKQPPPVTHFVIAVLGTGPEDSITDSSLAGAIKVDAKSQLLPEFPTSAIVLLISTSFIILVSSRSRFKF